MSRKTLLHAALAACVAGGALNATEGPVAAGLNHFSLNTYEQLAKTNGGNLVLSPYNIAGALSMALAGARGQTADEIAKVLGQAGVDPKYHAELAALIEQITKAANTGENHLLNANALWVQQDFKILPDFRDTLQNIYKAPPGLVDFKGDPQRAIAAINAWADQNTKGKIHELFGPGSLDARTRLVLASAVYFYGKWEHPFRHTETRPAPFTLPSGSTEQADFMNQTARFGYAETQSGQILEMRYAGTGLAFDILLPKKGEPAAEMESGLTPERLAGWLGSLHNQEVQASIPKFRVECGFPLESVLATMGMPTAFSGSADFSGIDDRRDLRISKVEHKAYVDVNEEGTEAAAATGIGVMRVAMKLPPHPVFVADHPFLFLIRDTNSGLMLFNGRLVNPKR